MEQKIEILLQAIKDSLMQMWNMIDEQIQRTEVALFNTDKELAREIIVRERLINQMDNKISLMCENYLALNAPVATDLREILATLRINSNLERIGDYAKDIAMYVRDKKFKLEDAEMKKLKLKDLLLCLTRMDEINKMCFEKGNTKIIRDVFALDDQVDKINHDALEIVSQLIKADNSKIEDYIGLITAIKRLERIGDRLNNIAEETIFYLEANIVKHTSINKENEKR